MNVPPRRYALVQIGQTAPPPPPQAEERRAAFAALGDAVRQVTPTLLIVGIATGAAFAIGSELVHLFLFPKRR